MFQTGRKIGERKTNRLKVPNQSIITPSLQSCVCEDLGVLVSIVSIVLLAFVVVSIKILIKEPSLSHDSSTFVPLVQMKSSNIKYTGNGYIPCNG